MEHQELATIVGRSNRCSDAQDQMAMATAGARWQQQLTRGSKTSNKKGRAELTTSSKLGQGCWGLLEKRGSAVEQWRPGFEDGIEPLGVVA